LTRPTYKMTGPTPTTTASVILDITRTHPTTIFTNTLNSIKGLIYVIITNLKSVAYLNPVYSVDILFMVTRKAVVHGLVHYEKCISVMRSVIRKPSAVLEVAETLTLIWTVLSRIHSMLLTKTQYGDMESISHILTYNATMITHIQEYFTITNHESSALRETNDECRQLCIRANIVKPPIWLNTYAPLTICTSSLTSLYSDHFPCLPFITEKKLLICILTRIRIRLKCKPSRKKRPISQSESQEAPKRIKRKPISMRFQT